MRLAISNIAWDVAEDDCIVELLAKHCIDAIDVAPGKYFPEPQLAHAEDVARVRAWWADRGFEIIGMQALLFGTTGLNIFGDADVQSAMLRHLDAVARIGAGLGATRLVFGSPKNRDRSGLSDDRAVTMAVEFFRRLGDLASGHGVLVCLEPNPTAYGANFMTRSDETARIVEQVAHPAIRMQFDAGAVTMNGEDAGDVITRHHHLVGHIHASEPNLVPLGDGVTDHARTADFIGHFLPNAVVSIEMLSPKEEGSRPAIERSLVVASRAYRQPPLQVAGT